MNKLYSICGYTRISVDLDEDRHNTSIENQKAIIEEYVQRHFPGSRFDIYEDRDKSGYTFDQREQYQIMRKKMLQRQYDILIVKDLSRFSRRNGQGLVELEYLRDAGMRIIAVGDNIDYPINDDWIRIQIYFLMNELPVVETSKKVKSAIRHMQSLGKWVCSVPYGYYLTHNDSKPYDIDPIEADTVRTIFYLYNSGWGYKRIANWLTNNGYPTPKMSEMARIKARGGNPKLKPKKAWSIATIQGILDNDFYIGTFRQRKYSRAKINGSDIKLNNSCHFVFENHHPAIIDAETFSTTQRIRTCRKLHHYRGTKKYPNAYSGLIFCGACGSPMFAVNGKDIKSAYICGSYHRRGISACTSHRTRVEVLDCLVKNYVQRVLNNSSSLLVSLQASAMYSEKNTVKPATICSDISSRLDVLGSELQSLKIQRIRDSLRHPEDTDILEETYDSLEHGIVSQIKVLQHQLKSIKPLVTKNQQSFNCVSDELSEIMTSARLPNDIILCLIEAITIYDTHIEMKMRQDFTSIFSTEQTTVS